MAGLTVLMYHALSGDADVFSEADPHYTVARPRFLQQLKKVQAAGLNLCSVRDVMLRTGGMHDTSCAALTFDDGHISNRAAAEEIVRHGGRADFFVNPGVIGRSNFLSWSDLRDMAGLGMSIQSHGYTHRYLDELSRIEVERELKASKKEIEDRLGQAVLLFAPAGGRMPAHFVELVRDAGYAGICSSRPGTWTPGKNIGIPRLAVLASTTDDQLCRWVTGARIDIGLHQVRYEALRIMKRLLGNHLYERVRAGLLRRSTQKVIDRRLTQGNTHSKARDGGN